MLYRFTIEVSDVDRDFYQSVDFRVAQHPSETAPFLLTRAIAYALNFQDGLEFAPGGLSDADTPCLSVPGPHGGIALWIEVGNPSARKLHKASKAAKAVKVYTYKNPDLLVQEIKSETVHRAEEIEIFAVGAELIKKLEPQLERDNRWTLLHNQGELTIDTGQGVETGELRACRI